MTLDRDCNNCKHHVQASFPPPRCHWCLTKTVEGWTTALPDFEPKEPTMRDDEKPMIFAHVGYGDRAPKQSDANAIQIGGTHYKTESIQPWDYILSNGLGYCEGAVVKYVTRYKLKGGLEDLKKARHFLDKLIEFHTSKEPV